MWHSSNGSSQDYYGNRAEQAHLGYEYLGDHAEYWIIVTIDGKEIKRDNVRFVASINWWLEEDSNG